MPQTAQDIEDIAEVTRRIHRQAMELSERADRMAEADRRWEKLLGPLGSPLIAIPVSMAIGVLIGLYAR